MESAAQRVVDVGGGGSKSLVESAWEAILDFFEIKISLFVTFFMGGEVPWRSVLIKHPLSGSVNENSLVEVRGGSIISLEVVGGRVGSASDSLLTSRS